MYVKNHMLPKEKLTILNVEDTIKIALENITEGDFLSLPVFDGDKFKGILMKEAIFRHYFEAGYKDREKFLNEVKVKDLYNAKYKSLRENDVIESAAYLLKELRTPFLPVLDSKDNFAGILTHTAIFNAFSETFGLGNGTRILVNVFDMPGQIAKLTEIVRKAGINIQNLAVMDAKVLDVYNVVIRVDTKNVDGLIEKITKAGFKVSGVTK